MLHTVDEKKPIIIFDFDGTLLNIDERWYGLHEYLAKKYHFTPVEKTVYLEKKKNGLTEKEIADGRVSPHDLPQYLSERIELIESPQFLQKDQIKNGVIDILEILSKKYSLILLTKRNSEKNALEEIKNLDLNQYFEKIFVTKGISKEHVIEEIISQSSSKPLYIIGDTSDDYEAAKKIHCKIILVTDGSRSKNILTQLNPDYLFDTITDIVSVV